LGDRDHEAQVGLHERALGALALTGRAAQLTLAGGRQAAAGVQLASGRVACLDGLRKTNLVVLGEQWVLSDVGEVEADKVVLVTLNALFRHRSPSLFCLHGGGAVTVCGVRWSGAEPGPRRWVVERRTEHVGAFDRWGSLTNPVDTIPVRSRAPTRAPEMRWSDRAARVRHHARAVQCA